MDSVPEEIDIGGEGMLSIGKVEEKEEKALNIDAKPNRDIQDLQMSADNIQEEKIKPSPPDDQLPKDDYNAKQMRPQPQIKDDIKDKLVQRKLELIQLQKKSVLIDIQYKTRLYKMKYNFLKKHLVKRYNLIELKLRNESGL